MATPLVILFEHPEWQKPLFAALERRGVPFGAFDLKRGCFDPDRVPEAPLYFNQASPSAYVRGNTRAVPLALSLMRSLELGGARVLNGSRAFSLELSKSAQAALMRQLGIAHPRTLAFNDVDAALAAWGDQWPALLKPEQGGSGARIYLLQSADDLVRLLRQRPEIWLPDNLLMIQEYFEVDASQGVVRMEFLAGELLYAMRIVSHGSFNLCPSETCNPEGGGESLCEVPETKPAKPVEFHPYHEVPSAAVESGKRIVAAGGLDVGGIEYLEARDGRLVFYDVNANSNLRPPVARAFGFEPFERLVDFLVSQIRLIAILLVAMCAAAQSPLAPTAPTRFDILRGEYGKYRANNDLLFYHLDIRVDPEKKFISGKTAVRFKMLQDDTRIQLDLHDALKVDRILLGAVPLKYQREAGAVFVDFPETLRAGRVYTIDFYYSGNPLETGRFGGITFRQDASGHPWVNTACEGTGASLWWPNKDQWRDEVENMRISVSIPNGLVDVSNGKFVGKTDLGDGYTRWDWLVQYPINNYDVSLNIGNYEHFADRLGDLPLDFYALPEDLEKAKKQFVQAKGMIEAYQHYFGEYPFKKDGYKLIEAPYSGMEHQSAVTYGNHFANGYLERDWTGVGISPKFDFIIIHESGHEWFGNSITAADRSDMWIHEGWTTYLESLYVEYMWGRDDALKYLSGYRAKVQNRQPIIPQRGANRTPPQDQYFKGALFLNTLRSVVDDDRRWWKLLHDFYQHFKYRTIMTEDVVEYFNQKTGMNLTPIFDEYLRHAALPALELTFAEAQGTVSYRWKADEPAFAMPVRVGTKDHWQVIQPTAEWKTMKTPLKKDEFSVATDLYFVNVTKS